MRPTSGSDAIDLIQLIAAFIASPLADATFTVPSSAMSILAPVFSTISRITLPPDPITSRILSTGMLNTSMRGACSPSWSRCWASAFDISPKMCMRPSFAWPSATRMISSVMPAILLSICTERGVSSLQMDIKIAGITEEIMRVALGQAKEGRMHILGEMSKALAQHRDQLGEHAPRIEVFNIPVDKIREVIGSGGKVIREIVEKTGAKIDIADDGTVKVASANGDAMKAAINWIKSIASEPEVGHIYDGTVVKVMDFGAFVNFFGAKDGLVHISQLAPRRVQKVTDVVKEGDKVKVKLLGFDERGKVRLSMKVVDQATGEDLEAKQKAEAEQQRGDQQREAAGAE